MEYNEKNECVLREALASARMEGLPVTPQVEKNVRKILSGEITVEERLRQIQKAQQEKRV